jgi:hypothetical protein
MCGKPTSSSVAAAINRPFVGHIDCLLPLNEDISSVHHATNYDSAQVKQGIF